MLTGSHAEFRGTKTNDSRSDEEFLLAHKNGPNYLTLYFSEQEASIFLQKDQRAALAAWLVE